MNLLSSAFSALFIFTCLATSFCQTPINSEEDALFIRKIYDHNLTDGQCYNWLEHMTTKIGGRLSGSPQAEQAVQYTRSMLDTIGFDRTWLLPCTVPHWVRGEPAKVRIESKGSSKKDLNVLALGNSVGTDGQTLTGEVIEVKHIDDLEILGTDQLKGKIVFFNRPMDPTQIRTFNAYGGAVDQRVWGAANASKFGAIAVLVRSLTTRNDDVPHTGVVVYKDEATPIPALCISTNDANLLSGLIKKEAVLVSIKANCKKLPDAPSFSVIGEIKGSEFPDEIILVGGHLDSWDVGQGAHDDGAGCVHAMQVIHTLKALGYVPKRTIRCVLFMNEENGLAGGRSYAKYSNEQEEYHVVALESDAGGFTPRGFSFEGDESIFKEKYKQVTKWLPLLEPYGLAFTTAGSGADIGPLKSQKGLLIGFRPDSQRYFDYHHTAIDTFDAINKRELELGAASIASLIYLIDKYGVK